LLNEWILLIEQTSQGALDVNEWTLNGLKFVYIKCTFDLWLKGLDSTSK